MEVINSELQKSQDEFASIDSISDKLAYQLPPSHPLLKMTVIIPAKNEVSEIEKTLLALVQQKTNSGELFPKSNYEILILCHNCTDNTYNICLNIKKIYPDTNIHVLELNSAEANTVGAARRILMNIACHRIKDKNGLIISTDADTIPNPLWLQSLDRYIDQKVDLICGFINSDYRSLSGQAYTYLKAKDRYLMLQAQLESLFLTDIRNPWPRHNYSWGPNLAIKKSVYKNIGGIKPLSFLEDVDLHDRVVENGFTVKHCLDTIVTTSARTNSRCPEGFGAELKVWTENEGIPYHVEGFEKLKSRYSIYNLIKQYYMAPSDEILLELSETCFIPMFELQTLAEQFPNYEKLMIHVKRHLSSCNVWHTKHPNCSVFKANLEMELYLSDILQTT